MRRDRHLLYRAAIFGLTVLVVVELAAIIRLSRKPVPLPAAAVKPARVEIAIVIDDFGYNLGNMRILKQIAVPLTCAVLPEGPYSNQAAQQIFAMDKEVIVHMPMQPAKQTSLEKNTVTLGMSEKQIKSRVDNYLTAIPFAKGASNHMGSAFTQDKKAMAAVIGQLHRRGLYFFDSKVTVNSVCPQVARLIGARFAERDIFFDNRSDPAYIRQQFARLKAKARQNGRAIAIAHDRRQSLLILAKLIAAAKKEGYEFVFLSALADGSNMQ